MLHQDFPALSRECDTFGNEHEVWFPSGGHRVWKATYPNSFGISPAREGEATPFEYLERMVLSALLFGDDWKLEGVWSLDDARMRLVSSQGFVRGDPATPEEIRSLFEAYGFVGIRRRGPGSGTDTIDWVHEEEGIVVRDAHGENILRTSAGQLVAIDLAVGRLA